MKEVNPSPTTPHNGRRGIGDDENVEANDSNILREKENGE